MQQTTIFASILQLQPLTNICPTERNCVFLHRPNLAPQLLRQTYEHLCVRTAGTFGRCSLVISLSKISAASMCFSLQLYLGEIILCTYCQRPSSDSITSLYWTSGSVFCQQHKNHPYSCYNLHKIFSFFRHKIDNSKSGLLQQWVT